jgi:hypothetical protein
LGQGIHLDTWADTDAEAALAAARFSPVCDLLAHDKALKAKKGDLATAGYVVGHGENIRIDCHKNHIVHVDLDGLLGQDNALKEKKVVMV